MKELDTNFKKRSKTYVQIGKNDSAYLYEVTDKDPENERTYFEVFFRKEKKATTLPDGKRLLKRIKYPSNADFGKWAWCISRGNDFSTAHRVAMNRFNFMDEYAKEKAA